jgi:hypothetical protein
VNDLLRPLEIDQKKPQIVDLDDDNILFDKPMVFDDD